MKTITGTFITPSGAPAAGATLILLLSQDAVAAGVGQVAHYPVTVTLDDAGNIPAGVEIWANDELLPAGTHYIVTVKDDTLGQVFCERLVLQGASPISLDSIPPMQH